MIGGQLNTSPHNISTNNRPFNTDNKVANPYNIVPFQCSSSTHCFEVHWMEAKQNVFINPLNDSNTEQV